MQINSPCPKCGKPLVRAPKMFYWRGEYRDGALCRDDNALWTIDGEEIPPLQQPIQQLNAK